MQFRTAFNCINKMITFKHRMAVRVQLNKREIKEIRKRGKKMFGRHGSRGRRLFGAKYFE